MDVVIPISAPIFVIVALSGTVKDATPSPVYSMAVPTFPLVVKILNTFNTISFAAHQGRKRPFNLILVTLGQVKWNGFPAIDAATSIPPTPTANIPKPPAVGV